MSKVLKIINDLSMRKRAVSCEGKSGLRLYLKELGFTDTAGKTEGHRVFTHSWLNEMSGFLSFSIDCGHRPNREMRLPYVIITIKILRDYQEYLEKYEERFDA